MIRMINGACRIGAELMSPQSGAFEAEPQTEKRLVTLGVAEYVGGQAEESPHERGNGLGVGGNTPENEPAENASQEADSDIPRYSMDTTAKELRAIGEKEGLVFKPQATKKEMVTQLDEHFGVADLEEIGLTAADIVV